MQRLYVGLLQGVEQLCLVVLKVLVKLAHQIVLVSVELLLVLLELNLSIDYLLLEILLNVLDVVYAEHVIQVVSDLLL